MDEAWNRAKQSIRLANAISDAGNAPSLRTDLKRSAESVVERCRAGRKHARALEVPVDLSDEAVRTAAKWSKRLPLQDYDGLLNHVPRLVNVVTCAEAVPVPGSGVKLPLDLHHIGARCSNAYFAPRRFSAVQLAFDLERCRVLVFRAPSTFWNHRTRTQTPTILPRFARTDTGRLVGTGIPRGRPCTIFSLVASSSAQPFNPSWCPSPSELRVRGPDGGAALHHAGGAPTGHGSRHPFARAQLSGGESGTSRQFELARVKHGRPERRQSF